jgi:hypothetical protein
MSQSFSDRPYSIGRFFPILCLANIAIIALFSAACGQSEVTEDAIEEVPAVTALESAEAVKASFIADIEAMREKYNGLAEAFPEETYTWRPMEGVRSVSEVLMQIASEGYGFAPTAFGGAAAMSREESGGLSAITQKAEVIDHLNKGFDHALMEIGAIDATTLIDSREVFGQVRTTPAVALFVAGDMHEHLGQLIAYARMNEIVPPWSM